VWADADLWELRASPQPLDVGHQAWTSPRSQSISMERPNGMAEDCDFLDDDRLRLPWGDTGMTNMGSETSEVHDLWTFTDDMGWVSPPDSYFHESGIPQNTLHLGDYWPQGPLA
jgi:hypothetical protein